MAHDKSPRVDFLEGLLRSADHSLVEVLQLRPRSGGLGNVRQRAAIEKKVAEVRPFKLFLIVEFTRPGPNTQPAMPGGDGVDEALLSIHVFLGAFIANERQAHAMNVEALHIL